VDFLKKDCAYHITPVKPTNRQFIWRNDGQCAVQKITDHSRAATTFLQILCSYCDIEKVKFSRYRPGVAQGWVEV